MPATPHHAMTQSPHSLAPRRPGEGHRHAGAHRRLPALIAIAVTAIALLSSLFSSAAVASTSQESIFQDEGLLQNGRTRDATLNELQSLGVDTIKAFVPWSHVAPGVRAFQAPSFNPADPASYPVGVFGTTDAIVTGALARGMSVILDPTGTAPYWASDCSRRDIVRYPHPNRPYGTSCLPDVAQFRAFVTALGVRYSGSYVDPHTGQHLPRVSRWAIWNEPNLSPWLGPQYRHQRAGWVDVAALRYRQLVNAMTDALRATGHGSDQIMLGEVAPVGQRLGNIVTRPNAPGQFLRDMFCIDGNGHTLRGAAAAALGCGGFRRLAVNAFADHPYTASASQPPLWRPTLPTDITIGTIGRLQTILRQAASLNRTRGVLPIYVTEFGFQTNPPERLIGVSLAQQALYINESEYLMWRNGAIKSYGQYELVDDRQAGGFETGLRFSGAVRHGADKPSLAAYRLAIYVAGGRWLWGEVRPGHGSAQTVQVQVGNGRRFRTVLTVTTNTHGYLFVRLPGRGPSWRLAWKSPTGQTYFSRLASRRG